MRGIGFKICFLLLSVKNWAQGLNKEYSLLIEKADSLFEAKRYKEAAFVYSDAFKLNGWKGAIEDRYAAACAWALANYPDSAFFNLERIASKAKFSEYSRSKNDSSFDALHSDKRWKLFLEQVRNNKEETYKGLNRQLAQQLDSILDEDQNWRLQIEVIEKKFGGNSKQMDSLWRIISDKDKSNLKLVTAIIDKHGWLGPDSIGDNGSSALFLVIQHSDLKTQQKYLPLMREAVKNKNAAATSLALLEDRVALGEGRKQIYGSQISIDNNGKYYVRELEDPDNVDKRRAEVGLGSLAEYVSHWNIKWDVEEYKKKEGSNDAMMKTDTFIVDHQCMLKWRVMKEGSNKPYIIELLCAGRWCKMGLVESLGPGEKREYSVIAVTQ
jgi:hypothetical protein